MLADRTPLLDRAVAIMQRQIKERCGARLTVGRAGVAAVEMEIKPGIGCEGFCIEDIPSGAVRISGNDERGLLYGIGKFLRTSHYSPRRSLGGQDGFAPGSWRGASVPEKEVRGIYFATHFHNFYDDAPIEKITHYLEDLALWGYNALQVWFDMHHFQGINDPAARKVIKRLRTLLIAAREIGMKTALTSLANEAYDKSPAGLRADQSFTGLKKWAVFGVELCPNKPGGKELMLRWREEVFAAFADIEIDYVGSFPYDQGGCRCEKCRPWGCNGYLMMAEEVARLARRYWPRCKFAIGTWLFDEGETNGEWEGLAKKFAGRPGWVDYILADSHENFPEYPLKKGVPGGLPLINFPEISMWVMSPWGGYGANPLPNRFQRLWDQAGSRIAGGFPYSEGLYEDINKVIISQFYWQQDKKAVDTVREYIAFEYSPDVVGDVLRAIEILEENQTRNWKGGPGPDDACEYLKKAEAHLSPYARSSWRWRILLLRGQIDRELLGNNGQVTEQCRCPLTELTEIYHAQKALPPLFPLRDLSAKRSMSDY